MFELDLIAKKTKSEVTWQAWQCRAVADIDIWKRLYKTQSAHWEVRQKAIIEVVTGILINEYLKGNSEK